jgi:hypothetical protein
MYWRRPSKIINNNFAETFLFGCYYVAQFRNDTIFVNCRYNEVSGGGIIRFILQKEDVYETHKLL